MQFACNDIATKIIRERDTVLAQGRELFAALRNELVLVKLALRRRGYRGLGLVVAHGVIGDCTMDAGEASDDGATGVRSLANGRFPLRARSLDSLR